MFRWASQGPAATCRSRTKPSISNECTRRFTRFRTLGITPSNSDPAGKRVGPIARPRAAALGPQARVNGWESLYFVRVTIFPVTAQEAFSPGSYARPARESPDDSRPYADTTNEALEAGIASQRIELRLDVEVE